MAPIHDTAILDFSRYVAEHTAGFVGRTWVFEAIETWLAQGPNGPRYFLLTGEPGSGKTAIAGRLYKQWRAARMAGACEAVTPDGLHAVHFCVANDRHWISPRAFAQALAGQLAVQHVESEAFTLPFGQAMQHLTQDLYTTSEGQEGRDSRDAPADLYEVEPWLRPKGVDSRSWMRAALERLHGQSDEVWRAHARVWEVAQTDLEAAMHMLERIGDAEEGWRTVAAGAALTEPERALALVRAQHPSMVFVGEHDRTLIGLIAGELARTDVTKALRVLDEAFTRPSDEKQRSDLVLVVWKGMATTEVVRTVAERDWHRALDLAERIENDHERARAFQVITAVLTRSPTVPDVASTYAELAVRISKLPNARYRQGAYRILMRACSLDRRPVGTALVPLISAMASADRSTFLEAVVDLVRLVCRERPDIVTQLQAALERVQTLLDV